MEKEDYSHFDVVNHHELHIFASDLFLTTLVGQAVSKRRCPKSSSETPGFWEGCMHPLQEDGTHS